MFVDLVKGRKARPTPPKSDESREDISDARLDEIMSELFGDADDDDEAPAPRKVKEGARHELEKAAEEDDLFSDEDEDDDDLEKGLSRREMMNKVYSMVDNLSDEELDSFLADRQIKKAQVMAIFEQMPTSDIKELVSSRAANGAEPMSPIKMAKGDDEDEDLFAEDDEI